MKINKLQTYIQKIGKVAMIMSLAIMFCGVVSQAREISREEALDSIVRNYYNWGATELSGKLYISSLPVAPTVKIYMKKGSDMQISVRAPFVGELGRIEITDDTFLAVNKFRRVYTRASMERIKEIYPQFVSNLQSLLLGRVVVFPKGELSYRNVNLLEITEIEKEERVDREEIETGLDNIKEFKEASPDEEIEEEEFLGWCLIYPRTGEAEGSFHYEYKVNPSGRVSDLKIDIPGLHVVGGMEYEYKERGSDMHLWADVKGNRKFNAVMELNAPRWGASPMTPIRINESFREVSISEFMNSLRR